MEYKIIDNIEDTKKCDVLLTKLIMSERKYDTNVKETFIVSKCYKNILNNNKKILIGAVDNNEIIGFIYGYLKEEAGDFVKENVALIDALYVLDEYRKKGIATKLIDEFYKWCKDKNVKIVNIGVFIDNKEAYNLYKKLGFVENTFLMSKYLD